MTTRYNSLIVVLEAPIREDDAEPIINAIKQIKGVVSVIGNVETWESKMAMALAKNDLHKKLWEVLK